MKNPQGFENKSSKTNPQGFENLEGLILMNLVLYLQNYFGGYPFMVYMKKFLSISFSSLILLSVMHVTIATHYCGSQGVTSEKVSVTGELASCGMEGPCDTCPLQGKYLGTHCCDDKVVVLAVDNNYAPSYGEFKAYSPHILQVFNIPESLLLNSLATLNLISTSVSPPGNFMVSAVSLPDICVFRI